MRADRNKQCAAAVQGAEWTVSVLVLAFILVVHGPAVLCRRCQKLLMSEGQVRSVACNSGL